MSKTLNSKIIIFIKYLCIIIIPYLLLPKFFAVFKENAPGIIPALFFISLLPVIIESYNKGLVLTQNISDNINPFKRIFGNGIFMQPVTMLFVKYSVMTFLAAIITLVVCLIVNLSKYFLAVLYFAVFPVLLFIAISEAYKKGEICGNTNLISKPLNPSEEQLKKALNEVSKATLYVFVSVSVLGTLFKWILVLYPAYSNTKNSFNWIAVILSGFIIIGLFLLFRDSKNTNAKLFWGIAIVDVIGGLIISYVKKMFLLSINLHYPELLFSTIISGFYLRTLFLYKKQAFDIFGDKIYKYLKKNNMTSI